MLKLKPLLIGAAAAAALGVAGAVAGDKIAPGPDRFQTMTVPLPGGGVARIEYSGPVKPRVTFEGNVAAYDPFDFSSRVRFGAPFAPFGFWDDGFAREIQRVRAMMDDMLAGAPRPNGLLQAGEGVMAPGSFSYSFTATTSGDKTCARSVQVTTSAGGKPEVVERTSGDCDEAAKPVEKSGEAASL